MGNYLEEMDGWTRGGFLFCSIHVYSTWTTMGNFPTRSWHRITVSPLISFPSPSVSSTKVGGCGIGGALPCNELLRRGDMSVGGGHWKKAAVPCNWRRRLGTLQRPECRRRGEDGVKVFSGQGEVYSKVRVETKFPKWQVVGRQNLGGRHRQNICPNCKRLHLEYRFLSFSPKLVDTSLSMAKRRHSTGPAA